MKTTRYKESLDEYKDLVNQPSFADYLGNAFSKAGSQPAVGPSQRMSNAVLSGLGAGFSGAEAEGRRQKLSPILEQAGRITAKAAELEAQMQQGEQTRLQMTQFFKQSAVPIAQLSQASLAGDRTAANELAKGVYLNFKQGAEDPSLGDFDHYHNGVIYYHNLEDGTIEGQNVMNLMYQWGVDPMSIWGQDALMIEAGLSPGAKKNYEDSERMRRLEMEGKNADIANKYSQAGYHNAQTSQLQNQMANPPQEKGTVDSQKLSQDLDVISKQLEKIGKDGEQGVISRVLSEKSPNTWQLTRDQTEIDTLGQLLRGQMFKAFGYRNETEFEQIPTISSRNSLEQNQAIIQTYKNLYLNGQQSQNDRQVNNNNDLSDLQ